MKLSIIRFVVFIALIMTCHAAEIAAFQIEDTGLNRTHSLLRTFCNFCDERFSPANNSHLYVQLCAFSGIAIGGFLVCNAFSNHTANWQWHLGNCTDDSHTDDPFDNRREIFPHTHSCEIYECIGNGCSEYSHGRFILLMGLIVSAIDLSIICCCKRRDYQRLPA